MPDVKVNTVELTLTTVKLTAKIVKQIPRVGYDRIRPLLAKPDESDKPKKPEQFVGWLHGTAVGDDQYQTYILVNFGDGEYGLLNCMKTTVDKLGLKQIYIS